MALASIRCTHKQTQSPNSTANFRHKSATNEITPSPLIGPEIWWKQFVSTVEPLFFMENVKTARQQSPAEERIVARYEKPRRAITPCRQRYESRLTLPYSRQNSLRRQACAIATEVSSIRLEKPHSLSYQLRTLTRPPSLTFVWADAKIDECGL